MGSLLLELLLGDELKQVDSQYEVQLLSGRSFHGTLSPRTSTSQLSISSGERHIQAIRSIEWERVQQVLQNEKAVSREQLLNLASKISLPEDSEQMQKGKGYSNKSRAVDQKSKANSSKVSRLEIDAHLGQWDNDIEYDGLLLNWTATDPSGNPIVLRGIVEAELYTTKRHTFNAVPQGSGYRYTRIGRWVQRINDSDSIQLPFQAANPEKDLKLGESGYLKIKFILPGGGVIQRQIEPIRIRRYSPSRDFQELKRTKYR